MKLIESKRILIVSNRLPVKVRETDAGLEFTPSEGGLATGLSSLHDEHETIWIGWPGVIEKDRRSEAESRLISEFRCHPVFLSATLSEKYYEGFCNRSIWPLFHSFTSYAKFSASEWEAYQRANRLFAEKIIELYRPGDVLWIHDYQLMTVGRHIREKIPDAVMGFFLHIPFPHFEILRLMPQHKEILEGLLAFDLVGFHTHDYAQAFLGGVRRSMGHDNVLGQLLVGDRVVHVDVFPMGIDFKKYAGAVRDPELQPTLQRIQKRMGGRKCVFTVSRLDYTKGIPESLEAIKEFLDRHPEWHEKITFVLVVVPSRENVERYAAFKREIDEIVGRINSEYGSLDWTPIRYIYRSLSFGELIGLYAAADVALITPLRDGMNLIAKEYIATKEDGKGVLVLSEMAGASKELLEAVVVNPSSKEEMAEGLQKALLLPEKEQIHRNRLMQQRLEAHGVHQWVRRFFARLDEAMKASRTLSVKIMDQAARQRLHDDYRSATRRLIVLDYDGTLVPFADSPDAAAPDAELSAILEKLHRSQANEVVVLSGRDRGTLERWLGNCGATLVAEHGAWIWMKDRRQWNSLVTAPDDSWKKEIRPMLELFVERIPGSFVEEKSFSLVWHYRRAESESASVAAREVLDTISNLVTNLPIHVLPGNKTVEVRSLGINKGTFFTRYSTGEVPEFILAAGDDWTDEDLFAVLPDSAYSIKVGLRISKARYNVRSYLDVRSILNTLEE